MLIRELYILESERKTGTFYYKPNEKLPEDMVKLFTDLAHQQRAIPESTMYRIKDEYSLMWLGELLEHMGDLIHGFAEAVQFNGNIMRDVERKLVSASRTLGPWFDENMKQLTRNFESHAKKRGISTAEYSELISGELIEYAAEHYKLPAYNHIHLLCKRITTALGGMQFSECVTHIDELLGYAKDGTLSRRALTITRDHTGVIRRLG
jgi:hypothetical protein